MPKAGIRFPRIPLHRRTAPNGLRTVVAPLPHLHTATLAVLVGVGSRHEDRRDNGLSHFLEHMLFRGTEGHPSSFELNLAIERLGGTLYGATHVDFTLYELTLPPETVEEGMAILGEILTRPVFREIETEKRIVREEILEGLDEDGIDIDIDDVSRDLLFGPHPLGFKITGDLSNLDRFEHADLGRHLARCYGAHNVVVAVSGAVEPEPTLDAVESAFEALHAGEALRASAPGELPNARFRYVENPGSQTDVRLCFPTFGERDPRAPALHLLARILDDGMSTRVHRRICDEKGLAYEAFASLDPYADCGVFDFGATVAHAKAPEVLEELLGLALELVEQRVTASELEKAKRRWLWDLRASLDDAEAVASFFGQGAVLGYEDDLESLAAKVEAVTPMGLADAAAAVFQPGRARAACVGVLNDKLRKRAAAVLG